MGGIPQTTPIGRRRNGPGRGVWKVAHIEDRGQESPPRGATRKTSARADWVVFSNRPAEPNLLCSRLVWLQSDPVIHRIAKSLLTSKVAFGCLDRDVSKQKLNLLQFAAGLVAESSACSPQVVRR